MKWYIYSCLALMACGNNTTLDLKSKNSQAGRDSIELAPATELLDTIVKVPILKAKAPVGIYQANLPCTDCKGIQHTVNFNSDHTFQLQEEKWDKMKKVSVLKGTWKITDSLIWLYKDQVVAARYKWKGDSLMFVDVRTGKAYPLNKQQSAWENRVWRNKKEEGLEFFGIGNEPFWSIEIDEQDSIRFQLADWSKPISVKTVASVRTTDSIVYNAAHSNGLHITIYNRFCNDGMSDFVYDNEVKVVYQQKVFHGCGLLYR